MKNKDKIFKDRPGYKMPSSVDEIMNFTEKELDTFLWNNYGYRGFNKNGLTFHPENRTIENKRQECINQFNIYNSIIN